VATIVLVFVTTRVFCGTETLGSSNHTNNQLVPIEVSSSQRGWSCIPPDARTVHLVKCLVCLAVPLTDSTLTTYDCSRQWFSHSTSATTQTQTIPRPESVLTLVISHQHAKCPIRIFESLRPGLPLYEALTVAIVIGTNQSPGHDGTSECRYEGHK
jgi:hypothetical protein